MNKLLKSLNKWKEAPVDVVILSFLRLHQYYVKEISRGRAGLGNYNLRPQYISAKIDLSEIVQFSVASFAGGVRYSVFGIPQSILHLSNARRRQLCHLRQVQYMVSPFLWRTRHKWNTRKWYFIFLQKKFKSETKEKKIISLLTTIPFLKLEAATTVRSKMIYVSYMFLSNFKVNILQNISNESY